MKNEVSALVFLIGFIFLSGCGEDQFLPEETLVNIPVDARINATFILQQYKKLTGTDLAGMKTMKISVELPGEVKRSDGGIPVLKGIVPIKAILDEESQEWLRDKEYEIGMWVDEELYYCPGSTNGFFYFEKGDYAPSVFNLKTTNFANGEHKITFFSIALDESLKGLKEMKVMVANPEDANNRE